MFRRVDVASSRELRAWLLSSHYEDYVLDDGRPRTYLGELVWRAKYNLNGAALGELSVAVRHCVLQLRAFGPAIDGLGPVTAVAAVPCNPPKQMSVQIGRAHV